MSANKLHDTIMEQIAAADGLVVVDGRTMVRRAVLRAVVRSVLLEVVDELRDELPPIVADDAEAAARLDAALDDLARRTEEQIAARFPTIQ